MNKYTFNWKAYLSFFWAIITSLVSKAKSEAIEGSKPFATDAANTAKTEAIQAATALASDAQTAAIASAKSETESQVGAATTSLRSYAEEKAGEAQTNAANYTDEAKNALLASISELTGYKLSNMEVSAVSENGTMTMENLVEKLLAGTATGQHGLFTNEGGNIVDMILAPGQSLTISDYVALDGTVGVTLSNGDKLFVKMQAGEVQSSVAQINGVLASISALVDRVVALETFKSDTAINFEKLVDFTMVLAQEAGITPPSRPVFQ